MNRPSPSKRDPHAHVIHPPGRRLLEGIQIRAVRERISGISRRSPNTSLNLVSFIDFLVVTVIFLLMSFSASGECAASAVRTPSARNGEDPIEAPTVVVSQGMILVDGVFAGSVRSVEELGRIQKIEELFGVLKNKRALWKQVQPNREFPGACTLAIDEGVPAVVVKSVFQTAAFAGYPNVGIFVKKLPSTI